MEAAATKSTTVAIFIINSIEISEWVRLQLIPLLFTVYCDLEIIEILKEFGFTIASLIHTTTIVLMIMIAIAIEDYSQKLKTVVTDPIPNY